MEEKFKPGDIVMLKSGGPKMTVREYDEESNTFFCEWFKDGELKKEEFIPGSLEFWDDTASSTF